MSVDHRRIVRKILLMMTVFITVSIALVGPLTFFALLVANLTYMITRTTQHQVLLLVAVLLGIICIIGGQTVLERVFSFNATLSVIIELVGGLTFYYITHQKKPR